MFKKKITPKILIFLILSDVLETVTQYFFKKSVGFADDFEVRTIIDGIAFLKIAFLSPFLWAGLLSVLLTFIVWSTILSKIDLSVAVPVCSFSYILVPIASIVLLGEKVTFLRWVGICVILVGVIFVSLSSKERDMGLE